MKRGIYILMSLLAGFVQGYAQQSNIEFVENKGQWDSRVQFKGELPTGALFLEKTGFSIMLYDTSDLQALTRAHHGVPGGAPGSPPAGGGILAVKGGKAVASTAAVSSAVAPGRDMLRGHAYRVSFAEANE